MLAGIGGQIPAKGKGRAAWRLSSPFQSRYGRAGTCRLSASRWPRRDLFPVAGRDYLTAGFDTPLGDRQMKMLSIAAAAAALLGAAQAQAAPAGCKLAAATVPVTMQGTIPVVEAKVAGKPVKLMLDSGSFYSDLTPAIATELKLKPAKTEKMGSLLGEDAQNISIGASGREHTGGVVVAPTFEFGGATYTKIPFLTEPAIAGLSGTIGQNLLTGIDNEYDFKNGVMRLIKPDGCETTQMAYWATPGMSYSMAPLEAADSRLNAHTIIMVTINGIQMKAFLDSGAGVSFITAHAAARAGVKTTDPGVYGAGTSLDAGRNNIATWVAPFASVKVGDEEIRNTRLTINDVDEGYYDVLLGADFMLAHHIYVANSQKKLYFTYSGGPVFRYRTPEDVAAAKGEPKAAK
jgi:predicted aspartyl protease